MTRTLTLMTLALLGVVGPASAADIDDLSSAAPTSPEPAAAEARGHGSSHGSSRGHSASRGSRGSSASRGGRVVHPTPNRPGRTVVHRTPGRPGRVVVHRGPSGHATATRAVRPHHVVVAHPPHHTYRYVRPYHGVLVYGPRPVTHVHYVNSPGPVVVREADLPPRAVDRADTFALGLKGGSLISGTNDGAVYGDAGLGIAGRYRPSEGVGLELGVTHHASGFDAFRAQTQVAGSLELFAYPWTRVSPYVLGGVTFNRETLADDLGLAAVADGQTGLHAGLGLEFALGRTAALDLEGRYIGWLTDSAVNDAPGAFQTTAGLVFHF